MKKTGGKGSTAKHTGTGKHGGTAKHHPKGQKKGATATGTSNPWTVAKHPTHAKGRALALPGEWDCCVAEALGASVRLAGWPVGDDEVLALHAAAGGSEDRGVPILDALHAAGAGFGGARPRFTPIDAGFPPGTVLGLELPGAHAVTVAGDGCWITWGEHYDPAVFPDAVIEEAWVVTWR